MTKQLFCIIVVCFGARFGDAVFRKVGRSEGGAVTGINIHNVGAGSYSPSKMSNWVPDSRRPLISPKPGGSCPGNIYNPSAVSNGATNYNIYFGGWDGVSSCKDSISITVTPDSFKSFHPHYPMIQTGGCQHVNNPSAIKTGPSSWMMMYTQDNNNVNKPGVSTATSGIDWQPSTCAANPVQMQGYPFNWGSLTDGADVNGGNVIYQENGTVNMWFTDFKQLASHSVFHATATVGDVPSFTYNRVAVTAPSHIVNDVKKINGQYVMGLHSNGQQTYSATSTDPSRFPDPQPLFVHDDTMDMYITSIGFVVDQSSTVLKGALYGAGAVSALDNNRIFAKWLQKQVVFISDDGAMTWGAEAQAVGPDTQRIFFNGTLSGKFHLYDADFVDLAKRGTLLEVSPSLTLSAGDIWEHSDEEIGAIV